MTTAVPLMSGSSSDRALSLEELAENEHRFRKLVEALPDAIVVHVGSKIVFVNPFAVRLHGAETPDQLVGHDISEFLKPECIPVVKQRIEECYANGTASAPIESVLVACDGSAVEVEAVAIPISWKGEPAMEVVLRDISKRKCAEEAAHVWQKRLELAQGAGLGIGLWDWDLVENTVTWSEETYRQFGLTRDTFSGRVEDATARVHPRDRGRVCAAVERVLSGQTQEFAEQFRTVRPNGTTCWIDAHGVIVRNGSVHMMGIGLDVTGLKKSEESLRQSEEKYRKLFENATYGVFLAKPDGTLLEVNPALVRMLGYGSREELLTRNLERDIYESPADRRAIIASAGPGKRVEGLEAGWVCKDGKTIPVRMSGAAILSEDGTVSHYEVIVEDISARRSLEEQYRQSQKMEAVGLLAGGISHDFNNLLGVILGNTELLVEKAQAGPQLRQLEAVKKAGISAAQLIRQLLAFSRKETLYPTILDVNVVVTETGKILHRLIGEDVRVATDLEARLGAVRADRGQIEQILLNLATNARDAMPGGGTFTIRTHNAVLGPEDVARYPYVKPGPYVRLVVGDTGTGMSDEVRARAFEPFFTTKEKGRGTGLGLATAYGIVKQSGGYIWVSSTPGSGTTFDIYLPRLEDKPLPLVPTIEVPSGYPRGSETVLLLEDDESLRQVTGEFLTAGGYNVLHSGRGDVALDLADQYKGAIPLVISDVVLPGMSGPLAVSKLQTLHPEMRVLYVSGYAEVPVAQQLIAGGAVVLQKPVSRMDLLSRVNEMLHSRPDVQTNSQSMAAIRP